MPEQKQISTELFSNQQFNFTFKNANRNNETQNSQFSGTSRTNNCVISVFPCYTGSRTKNSERSEHLATLLHAAVMLGILSIQSPVVTICTTSLHSTILRSAHTLYLCVLCGSQNIQPLFPYTTLTDWFLDAFCNMRKAAISLIISVRPAVCISVSPSRFKPGLPMLLSLPESYRAPFC